MRNVSAITAVYFSIIFFFLVALSPLLTSYNNLISQVKKWSLVKTGVAS